MRCMVFGPYAWYPATSHLALFENGAAFEEGRALPIDLTKKEREVLGALLASAPRPICRADLAGLDTQVDKIREILRTHGAAYPAIADGSRDSLNGSFIQQSRDSFAFTMPLYQALADRRDASRRLFWGCANGLLGASDMPRWRPEPPQVTICFAATTGVVASNGSIVLPLPGQNPPGERSDDDYTGDGVALMHAANALGNYGMKCAAVSPARLGQAPPQVSDALWFLGSPIRNDYLKFLEERDPYRYGARFDVEAPVSSGEARISFRCRPSAQRSVAGEEALPENRFSPGTGGCFTVPLNPKRDDYVVIRRWRTVDGNDAILIAGTSAPGTAAGVEYATSGPRMAELFQKVGISRRDAQATEFDAILHVALLDGRYRNLNTVSFLGGERRIPD